MESYLTIKEIAKKFNRSESSVRNTIYNRQLVSYQKIGHTVLIKESDFTDYIEKHGVEPITEQEVENWYKDFQDGMSISDILKKYKRDGRTISKTLKQKYKVNTQDYHRKRSPEEKEILSKMRNTYLEDENISISKVLKMYNYTNTEAFVNYLKRTGEKIKSTGEVLSFVSQPFFFSNIDSEIKAYLLGFFAADGHIEEEGALKISVQLDDAHIVILFNKHLCGGKSKIRCKDNMVYFSCRHQQIRKDIYALGFNHKKTYDWKNLPSIPENMYPHFIRGYFDGDGSIMVNRRRTGNTLAGYNKKFALSCYNKTILEQVMKKIGVAKYKIRETIKENFKIRDSKIKKASGNLLEVFDTVDLKIIHSYLYSNATYFFKRKKDKFDLAILSTSEIDDALQGNL